MAIISRDTWKTKKKLILGRLLLHLFRLYSRKMIATAFVVSFSLVLGVTSALSRHPLVLLVAIDGFGFDYLERGLTPVIQRLKDNGSSARYMYNAFPTVTCPNFFSISTGLHPEVHGVIGNRAFNENFKCLWRHEDVYELFHYDERVIPLWTLNELSGDERYSATLGWPSSEYDYRNHPIAHNDLSRTENSSERIDQTIRWFLDDNKPANLAFLYFGQLDAMGHKYGPNSPEVNATLKEVDRVIDYLLTQLEKFKLLDKMNIIILSDHGMLEVPKENLVDFRDWLKNDSYEACGESPYWQIKITPGHEQEVYEKLQEEATKLGTFDVYKKEDIPERWHVKHNKRQADLLLLAKPNSAFYDAIQYKGDHGYDPDADIRVRPLFVASGPLFQERREIEPFSNLDIFPLVSKILRLKEPLIKPNGTITFIQDILKPPQPIPSRL